MKRGILKVVVPELSPGHPARSLAEALSQPLCAIAVNVEAMTRILATDTPDLDELRAALADLSHDTQRACELLLAVRPAGGGAPSE